MIATRSGLSVCVVAALLPWSSPAMAAQPVLPPRPLMAPIYVPPANQNISGVWWIKSYSAKIPVVGGGDLPFTDEGRKRFDTNAAALKADPLSDDARRICLPDGVPRILGNPYPFQILQVAGRVTILYELNKVVRHIPLEGPPPTQEDLEYLPYFSGHPMGRWEGDTLVIETAGHNDRTFIDATGVPHSAQLRTVERVRKLDARTLEIVVTVTDPVIFRALWSARFVYDLHPEILLQDYVCGDRHRDISHIPGVSARN